MQLSVKRRKSDHSGRRQPVFSKESHLAPGRWIFC